MLPPGYLRAILFFFLVEGEPADAVWKMLNVSLVRGPPHPNDLGKSCKVDATYSAVRWLSGQDYAQTHNVQQQSVAQPRATSFTHSAGRLLFSWDLPIESGTTTERNQAAIATFRDGNDKKANTIQKHPKNVWWPWNNYEEWLTSRMRHTGTKYNCNNNTSEKDAKFYGSLTNKIHRKTKKKQTMKSKQKQKKHKNKRQKLLLKVAEDEIFTPKQFRVNGKTDVQGITYNTTKYLANGTHDTNSMNLTSLDKTHHTKEISETNYKDDFKYIQNLKDVYKNNIVSDNEFNNNRQIYRKLPGVLMARKNFLLDDTNECLQNNGGCEALCINLPGSYRCHCPQGFRLDSTRKKCLDINECIARNGHGPCQGDCINTWGSFRCGCDRLTGTKLAGDGRSCEDIDECNSATNRLGCSHDCVNTVGTAFCLCPNGYELGPDWSTCQDVDECKSHELQNFKCSRGCVNTLGSYRCL